MINLFKLDFSVFQATVFVEDAPIPPPPSPTALGSWNTEGVLLREKKKNWNKGC